MTTASSKLAKAQEVSALKGLKAAVPYYIEATNALAQEQRWDAAVSALADVLNAREKKRGLFGSKEVDPLGSERAVVGRQFAKLTRSAQVNDSILELLTALATENPDDPGIRLANAEGLYRGAYMADAIDEYRYCERLIPDDGAIVARLGELYSVMSRNSEAVDCLQRGIGELMQSQRFDGVPFFAQKLLEVSPQAASDVARWLESLPEDAFARQRSKIAEVVSTAHDAGVDDARWASVQQRLDEAPQVDLGSPSADVGSPSANVGSPIYWRPSDDVASEEPSEETEPQTAWTDQPSEARASSAWDDISSVEPASDDEIRILFGSSGSDASDERESLAGSSNGVTAATSSRGSAPSQARAPTYTSSVNIGSTQPTAAGGLPPGLAAFTRRKGDAAFTAGDFGGAAASYERLMKAGFDPDVAGPLVECYLGLERFTEASALGLQLADHQVDAGELDKALATLALILEHTSDPDVERRRTELLTAK